MHSAELIGFHKHLDPLIAVLEPQREYSHVPSHSVHTIHHLRQTSTVLFSCILAASSKFFKKDLHGELLSHAQTVTARAVVSGDEATALVQALQILVYFKTPEDTSAWRKLGWAIRMGYQLHWHLGRHRPLPSDRQAALEVLDAERAWILLYVFDRSYSRVFGLPPTIKPHEIGDVKYMHRAADKRLRLGLLTTQIIPINPTCILLAL